MDQVPAVVMEDVRAEEQSTSSDVAPSTAVDVTSTNGDEPPSEDTADSERPASCQDLGLYCCQDCRESFSEEAAYLDHRHQHPDGKCTMYLEPMDDSDMADEDEESTSACQLCTRSFADMSAFRSHMETHRVQSSDTQQISGSTKKNFFECAECGKRYSTLGHFLNHQRTHIQASKSLFNDLEHLKKKSFQCETCGRNYSRASALDAHRRCHEEKLFKRKYRISGLRTPPVESAAKLIKKQTSGTSEKLFKCACGKSFSVLMHLKTHQRFSHNNDCFSDEKTKLRKNVFYCRECRKAFHGHLAWFNHEKWHENHSNDSPTRFQCEACGKVFVTQMFYDRHQRMVHSGETQAKSFLHQVDQLQKKAFECTDCDLKFSRPSALHSHQLQHANSVTETEQLVQAHSPLLHQQETLEGELKVTQQLRHHILADNVLLDVRSEDHTDVNEPEDDAMESYEPGDFNVLVISASESEDEAVQDLNPKLDSGSVSDQEGRDNTPVSNLVSKPDLDLKIVQVDFDPAKEQCPPGAAAAENNDTEEQFACADCYRCFASEPSLRAHLVWHNIRKRRRQTKGQSVEVYTCEYENKTNQKLKQADVLQQKTVTCDMCGTDLSHLSDQHDKRLLCRDCETSSLKHMSDRVSATTKVYNPKKTLLGPKIYHCEQCGKGFWSLGAYSHHKQSPSQCVDVRLRTGVTQPLHRGRSRSSMKVACPVCGRKFRHRGIMTLHMRTHENGNHKCEICNKSFRLFSSLIRHQVVHNELLPPPIKSFEHQVEQLQKNTYSCPDCGKLFSRAKALQFHMRYHGNESGHSPSPPRSCVGQEDLQCATCLKHFSSKASLRTHRKLCIKKEYHIMDCKIKNLTNEPLKLSEVNSQGSEVKNFKNEMEEVHMESSNAQCGLANAGDLRYKCNKCERSFSVVGALNLHKRIHAKGYKKVAKTTSSLVTGEEELRKDYQFPCSECGKRFLSNSALGSHKRWHTNGKRSSLKEQLPDRCLQDCQTSALQPQPDLRPKSETLDLCPEGHQKYAQGSFLNEHSITLEAGDTQTGDSSLSAVNRVTNDGCETISTILIAKNYQCPLCLASFSKARGLRAHTWQAHSESKDKPKSVLDAQITRVATSCEIKNENVATEISCPPVSKFDDPPPSVPNLECGLKYEADATIPDHKCPVSKQVVQAPDPLSEVSPLISRLSEPIVKCLFKCGKCGKAFQTEGQLETHKAKAKSRPFCCALCCNTFLTESQLQQHLAWHDQVRFRLPNEVRLRLSAALNTKSVRPTGKSFPPRTPNQHAQKHESQSVSSSPHGAKAFLSSSTLQNHKSLHCKNAGCDSAHASVTVDDLRALSKRDQAAIGDSRWQRDGPAAVLSGDTDILTCLECGAAFSQETDLHQHYTKHAQAKQRKVAQDCGPKTTKDTQGEGKNDDQDMVVAEIPKSESALQTSTDGPGLSPTESSMKSLYRCLTCGKAYFYPLSFEKHQAWHKRRASLAKSPIGDNAREYNCPMCGMTFYRETRLRGHLLTHMSHEEHKCDQCNKTFDTLTSWLVHDELHKTRPFWCLSCHRGFMQEDYLSKHLQRHHLGKYKCYICSKRFFTSRLLGNHLSSSHASSRPDAGATSQKKVVNGSGDEGVMQDGSLIIANDKEEQEPQTRVETGASLQKSGEQFENQEFAQSDASDCGEFMHQPPRSSSWSAGEEVQKAGEAQTTQELGSGEQPEQNQHGEQHKYWEFECFECGQGFDDLAQLHLHYVQHAVGEVPFPD